ncbi:MAG TPA: VOC family protein, partial [Deinococcales bacterium]|nr:VOC family protein [Deinococcales bacterium]
PRHLNAGRTGRRARHGTMGRVNPGHPAPDDANPGLAGVPGVLGLDHVAVAAPNLDEAARAYLALGFRVLRPDETVETAGVRVRELGLAGTTVELLQPLNAESPVARFLERRGPGLHHLALRVASVRAALDACPAAGLSALDREPRPGRGGTLVAFLHPTTVGGALVELVEWPGRPQEEPPE